MQPLLTLGHTRGRPSNGRSELSEGTDCRRLRSGAPSALLARLGYATTRIAEIAHYNQRTVWRVAPVHSRTL